MNILRLIIALLIGFSATKGYASSECKTSSADCAKVGVWEFSVAFGLGMRTTPIVDGEDMPILVLPKISYYGERFFFDTTEIGFTLIDRKTQMLNLIVTASFEQMYFKDWSLGNFAVESTNASVSRDLDKSLPVILNQDNQYIVNTQESPPQGNPAQDPIHIPTQDGRTFQLDQSYYFSLDENGNRSIVLDPNGQYRLQLNAEGEYALVGGDPPQPILENEAIFRDAPVSPPNIDDLNDRKIAALAGLEYGLYFEHWSAKLQVLSDVSSVHKGQELRFAASRNIRRGKNTFNLASGFSWQSDELLDYYYGVSESETNASQYVYQPSDGISPFVRLDWQRKLGSRWTFELSVHQKWLSKEISDSPVVDKKSVSTLFIGGRYHF